MIQQTFRIADESCSILQYKRENLILDIATDKKLNAAADKTIDINKEQDIVVDK